MVAGLSPLIWMVGRVPVAEAAVGSYTNRELNGGLGGVNPDERRK
jgi:hypothetical protein